MKIDIERYEHDGIPVLVYSLGGYDKLIFVNHGLFGNKDTVMKLVGPTLVRLGYKVVSIDAYKHGERGQHPYKDMADETLSELHIFDVVRQTASDLLKIRDEKYPEFEHFDVLGISMGGYLAYYLATLTADIRHLIPIISSPAFMKSRVFDSPDEHQNIDSTEIEAVKKRIERMDPSFQPEELSFEKAIVFNGKHDTTVPPEHTETFIRDNPEMNIHYERFDTGHQMVPAMQERLAELLKNST